MAKILVVDDRPLNRELLRTLLQYQAHDVLEAGEGAEALQVARQDKPELIITDILMPNMDGYEFVRQLRQDKSLSNSTVIFYTASYKNREAADMAHACGVEYLLFKPCEPEDILATVAQALAERIVPEKPNPLSLLASTSFRLTALTELCLDLSAERDPAILLEKFCYSARELVKASFSVLVVDHEYPTCFLARQTGVELPETLADWQFRVSELFQDQEVFCISQSELAQKIKIPLRNALGVSLRSRSEVYGWLCCFDKQDNLEFDDQDQHLMLTLAAQVGQTYENAVMYAQLQQQAIDLQIQNEELKTTQQALIQSREHRRLARKSAGIGTWDLNLDTQYLYWDERMLEIYGLQAESFANRFEDWQACVHPDDFAMMMAESYQNTGQETFRNVHRAFLPDGSLRYVESTGQMLFDENHRPVRLVGIGIDITERRKAEEDLIARDQLLENLTRQVPGMIYQHRVYPDGRHTMPYASEGIRRIFGLEPEDVRENMRLLFEHLHPADYEVFRASVVESTERMSLKQTTYRVCRDGAVEKWVYGESMPERLEDGSILWNGYLVDITEQRQLEQSLIESEERLRLAKDIAGFGIWERDLKTGETVFDERMYELYELTPALDSDPFQTATEKIHPDDRMASRQAFAEALTTFEPVTTIARIRLEQGKIRFVEGRAQVFADAEGHPSRMIGMIQDITERKQTESALLQRDQLLENLTRQVPGMIYQHCRPASGQSYMSYASEGIIRIFGLQPEDVRTNASLLLQHVHPSDRNSLQQAVIEATQQRTVCKVTYRVCLPGEPDKWVYGESVPEFFDDGSSVWYGYIVDISEQRQLAQSLSESEERLLLARDIAEFGVWELNLVTNQLIYDQRMYDIYEISPELNEGLLETVTAKVWPEDIAIFEQQLANAIQTLEPVITFGRVTRKNGETCYIEGRAQAFLNADGLPARMVGMAQDITERHLAQERLKDYQYQLEGMIVQLRDLAIRAEAANLAKGEFLNNISHELRTPLNGVLGMSYLLLDSELDQTQRSFTEIIVESGKSLLGLIDDVLDFSNIREYRLETETTEFSLSELLDSVIQRIEPLRARKQLNLEKKLDLKLPPRLIGDSTHLAQVLYHLLENAIKFTPKGLLSLSLIELEQSPSEVKIRFEVRDTGIGVAPEQIEQIFEPFNQADNSLTRRFGGSGIGLSLATRLVEFMGGQIQCESRLGEGSRFWFELSFSLPAALPVSQFIRSVTHGGGPKILLVEDNPINQVVTVAILEKIGYGVTVVDNGCDALNLVEAENWLLVLMDCQMPVMDGYEATRRIRQAEAGQGIHLPVIAVTAHVSELDRQKCFDCGMDDYLPKPFGLEELSAIIERWIGSATALAD